MCLFYNIIIFKMSFAWINYCGGELFLLPDSSNRIVMFLSYKCSWNTKKKCLKRTHFLKKRELNQPLSLPSSPTSSLPPPPPPLPPLSLTTGTFNIYNCRE